MNLERRFIVAVRPKYNNEDLTDYIITSNKLRCYIILKDYGTKFLAIELKYFEKEDRELLKLSSSKYHFLTNDVIISRNVVLLNYDDITKYSHELVDNHDLDYIMTRLNVDKNSNIEYGCEEYFNKFIIEYYSERIKKGSVINIKNEGRIELYYVKEKYEDSFLGIKLHYDYRIGLTIDGEEKIIPFGKCYGDIFYEENYSTKVLSMINKH